MNTGDSHKNIYPKNDLLERLSYDHDPGARNEAIRLAGITKEKTAVPVLLGFIDKENDEFIKETIIWALGNIGDYSAIPTLIRFASSEVAPKIRDTAMQALANFHDPRVEELFITQLGSAIWRIQQLAIEGLGAIGGERAVKALQDYLCRKQTSKLTDVYDQILRSFAAVALGRLGDPVVLPCLLDELRITKSTDSIGVVVGLGLLGDVKAIPHLISYLSKVEGDVRKLEGNDTTTADQLRNEFREKLVTVSIALSRLMDRHGMHYLQDFISNEVTSDEIDRYEEVIDALARLGEVSIIPRLIELLKVHTLNDNEIEDRVHHSYWKALKELTGEDFGINYQQWETWYKSHQNKIT